MNPRYLETVRRHWMLFLCLMTLSVVVATWAAVGRPTLYRSSASLWSDTATGAATAMGLPPPASQEQTMLNELLTTQFFRSKVAREAPLADYLEAHPVEGWGLGPSAILARLRPTPSVDDRIQEALGPGRVTSLVQGPHVLEVRFDAADAGARLSDAHRPHAAVPGAAKRPQARRARGVASSRRACIPSAGGRAARPERVPQRPRPRCLRPEAADAQRDGTERCAPARDGDGVAEPGNEGRS